MAALNADEPMTHFSDETWADVIAAMDRTYSELIAYQELLETQNAELNDMRRFMDSVLSSVSDMLIVVDRSGGIERVGGAIDAILGANQPFVAGVSIAEALGDDAGGVLLPVMDNVIHARAPAMIEVDIDTAEGPTPLEMSVSPRLDDRGRSRGVVLVGRPVGELRNAYSELAASHTALQETQSHLVRNEKLASLGRLVAGVAHELNNPISFVYANTHALEKYAARFETYFEAVQSGKSRPELVALRDELRLDRTVKNLRAAIEGAKDGAERVRDIVEDLRRLSAEGTAEAVRFDLMTTTRTAADWVVRGTKTPVRVTFAGDCRRQAIGHPGHVQQIVMNLVQNAIDALGETQDAEVVLSVSERQKSVVLQVADNGPGIPDDVVASIFDPFFTTKDVGKGTGLGLSISHKIAEEHGGSLLLAQTGPDGSVFELVLPAEETE